ncbi:MAG: sulfotransferase [Gemmatimonadales bacterium]
MQPFFVIGFQRSGTTLLRVMLDAHPDIAIPLDVTGLWWRFERQLDRFGDLTEPATRRALLQSLLAEERIKLWQVPLSVDDLLARWTAPGYPGAIAAFYQAYASHHGKPHWGDKDPGNMTRIDVLNRWFPAGRILHIIRDGRGACASLIKQSFGSDDLMECADQWREEVSWVRRMGRLLGPARYHEVRYETLVTEPAAVLQEVCAFLDVRYSDAMLTYPETLDRSIPAEKRHLWPLIGERPQADNADRWRASIGIPEQVCFEKRAGSVLQELGYPTSKEPWRGRYGTEIKFLLARATRAIRQRFSK